MKKNMLLLLLIIFSIVLVGCTPKTITAIGEEKSQEIILDNKLYGLEIKNIKLKQKQINLIQSDNTDYKIIITSDKALIDNLKITNKDSKIIIDGGRLNKYEIETVNIYLPLLNISKLSLNGDFNINYSITSNTKFELNINGNSEGTITFTNHLNEIRIVLNGNANLRMNNLDSTNVSISLNGNTSISSNGKCEALDIISSGDININFSDLISNKLKIKQIGTIKANINATTDLNINATGTGYIYYKKYASLSTNIKASNSISTRESN